MSKSKIEALYKKALSTNNKKAIALVLSLAIGLSGCTFSKRISSLNNDKYIVYVKDDSDLSNILKDADGKKIKTKEKIVYFVMNKKSSEGRIQVIAVDELGKLYDGYIPEVYLKDLEKEIYKDIEDKVDYSMLENIPGALYKYGPEDEGAYVKYSFDEEKNEITFDTKTIKVTKEATSTSSTLTYLNPGSKFVLLFDDDNLYKSDDWNKVAVLLDKNTIAFGYINKNDINLDDTHYFKYIKTNPQKKKK